MTPKGPFPVIVFDQDAIKAQKRGGPTSTALGVAALTRTYLERQPWSAKLPDQPVRVNLEDLMGYYERGGGFAVLLIRLDFRVHLPQWRVLLHHATPATAPLTSGRLVNGTPLRPEDVAFAVQQYGDHRTWLHFDGLTVPLGGAGDVDLVSVLGAYPWPAVVEELGGIENPFLGRRGVFEVHGAEAFRTQLYQGVKGGGSVRAGRVRHTPGATTLLTERTRVVLHRAPEVQLKSVTGLNAGALGMLTYTRGDQCWALATMFAR